MIYEDIFKGFEENGVRYLVVGGTAVNIYGYVRLTMDLDIMVDLSDHNLVKLIDTMKQCGYSPRVPVEPVEFISRDKRDEWIKEKGAIVFTFIDPENPYRQIDIFLVNPIEFEDAYSRRADMKIRGLTVSVISIEDLIKLKILSGRERDIEDVHQLENIRKLKEQ